MRAPAREYSLLALAFLLAQLPFLGQALVIDDGNFVDQALQILKQPGAPYSFPIHFSAPLDFFYYFANPPGLAYFFAPVIAAFGSSEVVLHAASLGFSWLAVACMVACSQRLAGSGLLGALLLLSTPAFLVSSHTLMADVPAAALALCALHLFVRGVDEQELRLLALAGVAAGSAALLKYSGLSVAALMLLYAASRSRQLGVRQAVTAVGVSIGVAALLFGAWCLASQVVYGELHLLAAGTLESHHATMTQRVQQAIAALADLGGATIFAPILLAWSLAASFSLGRGAGLLSVVASLLLAAIALLPDSLSLWEAQQYSLANRSLLALLLAAGTATFCFTLLAGIAALRVVAAGWRAVDDHPDGRAAAVTLLLAAWVLGFVLIDARLLFATPKYLVPAIAPLILLLLRSRPGRALAASAPAAGGVVAATAAFGLLLSLANASYAGSLRRFVSQTVPEIASGRTAWFTGHHAVRYYAQEQGHRWLPERLGPGSTPRVGDLVYVIRGASKHAVPSTLQPRLEAIAEVDARSAIPLIMNNLRLGAGYWAHGAVPLPYAFSNAAHSRLEVLRVRP